MKVNYSVLSPKDLENIVTESQTFALDVLLGLSETPKRLQSKYFYDETGSNLFQKIMGLPEYYLTRCEYEIIDKHKENIRSMIESGSFNLVELGAGDGLKTSLLIEHFLNNQMTFRYVPIDISESAMQTLIKSLTERFPGLVSNGIVAEYFDGLKWLSQLTSRTNVVLFLGSNLGNFQLTKARVFLRSLWNTLKHGDLVMIGFDLKKNIELMLQAYNDSQGVTAAFNLNLLERINRELGGDFDIKKFRFYASYNVFSGAIESYLVSLEDQVVTIDAIGQSFTFKSWEPIHTEYSYKFLVSEIEMLAEETGYQIVSQLFDSKEYFVDSVWRVIKGSR